MRFLPLASPGTPTARAARPLRAVPWRQTALFLCVLATAGCASLAPTDGALPAVAVPPAWSAGGNGTAQGATAQRSRASNSTGNTFQAGFDASWEPDVFGRLRSGVSASEADARAAEASLADVQVSLAAEVAVNYIELRGLQQRLAIARSNLASQQETLQITQW